MCHNTDNSVLVYYDTMSWVYVLVLITSCWLSCTYPFIYYEFQLKRQNSAYRTRTRTRRFVIDGQTITTTSKRIVNTNLEDKRFCEDEQ